MDKVNFYILILALKALDGKLKRKDFCIMGSEDEDGCMGCIKFYAIQRAIKLAKKYD